MTIKYDHSPVQLSQEKFNKLDYKIMGFAFDLHNKLGNLWDEKEYQQELVTWCTKQGFDTFSEVPVSICHNGFNKTYFIDVLVNGSVYELKTTSCISDRNEAQTLNYLFLTDTLHGKIINFRPDSLTWRFVSTTLRHKNRLDFSIDTEFWNPSSKPSIHILEIMKDLLYDWGTYLSINLYREALCYLIDAPLENEHQRFIPLTPETTLYLSALSARKNNLRNNLKKYLARSSFNELLWINFNQNKIEFSSLNHSA